MKQLPGLGLIFCFLMTASAFSSELWRCEGMCMKRRASASELMQYSIASVVDLDPTKGLERLIQECSSRIQTEDGTVTAVRSLSNAEKGYVISPTPSSKSEAQTFLCGKTPETGTFVQQTSCKADCRRRRFSSQQWEGTQVSASGYSPKAEFLEMLSQCQKFQKDGLAVWLSYTNQNTHNEYSYMVTDSKPEQIDIDRFCKSTPLASAITISAESQDSTEHRTESQAAGAH